MTAWQLPNDCLTTSWRLIYDCLMTTRRLPDNCLTTAWWLPDKNYSFIRLPEAVYSLNTIWYVNVVHLWKTHLPSKQSFSEVPFQIIGIFSLQYVIEINKRPLGKMGGIFDKGILLCSQPWNVYMISTLISCGTSKMVGPKKQDFWPRINIIKGKKLKRFCRWMTVHQKVTHILKNFDFPFLGYFSLYKPCISPMWRVMRKNTAINWVIVLNCFQKLWQFSYIK